MTYNSCWGCGKLCVPGASCIDCGTFTGDTMDPEEEFSYENGRDEPDESKPKLVWKCWSVGDVIRTPAYPDGETFRVWRVVGVHAGGGEYKESVVEIETLDKKPNGRMYVPHEILDLLFDKF